MTTVKELIEILERWDENDVVVLAVSPGGEPSCSPLADVTGDKYVADSTWAGDVYIRELTPDLRRQGFTEEDVEHGKHGVNCVTLWPTF